LADNDRKHQKRLKEARKTWDKYTGLYKDGKISSDDLKDKLRPYKAELVEIGLIKGDKKEEPKEETQPPMTMSPAEKPQKRILHVRTDPWQRRSNLSMDEIRRKVDLQGLQGPSESLKESYRSKYGEDLSAPSEEVVFQVSPQASAPDPSEGIDNVEEIQEDSISDRSKGFLKSLFNKGKGV
jgi:hypothetical protein